MKCFFSLYKIVTKTPDKEMMNNQVTPTIETVELFAPNTGNRQVTINGVMCYEWEFQGILYYPTVEFVPYEENPCQDPIKEVYRLDGSRVGTLQWFDLNLNVYKYTLDHDEDDDDDEDDEDDEADEDDEVARQAAAELLLNRNTNPDYAWNTTLPDACILENYYGHKYTYNLNSDKLVRFQYNHNRYNEHSRHEQFLLLHEFAEDVKYGGDEDIPIYDFEQEFKFYSLRSLISSTRAGIFHICVMEDEIPLYLEPAILLK